MSRQATAFALPFVGVDVVSSDVGEDTESSFGTRDTEQTQADFRDLLVLNADGNSRLVAGNNNGQAFLHRLLALRNRGRPTNSDYRCVYVSHVLKLPSGESDEHDSSHHCIDSTRIKSDTGCIYASCFNICTRS